MVKRRLVRKRDRSVEVVKKPRPSEKLWIADVAWKRRVLEKLGTRSQNWLAKEVGMTSAMMSLLLGEKGRNKVSQTAFLPRINKVVGLSVPTQVTHDDIEIDAAKASIDENWDYLSDEDRAYVKDLVSRLARRSENR